MAKDWDVPPALAEHEANEDSGGLLGALLRIFSVNAHAFHGSAALFNVATKLTHTCHNPMVEYVPEPSRGVGMFVATTDIPVVGRSKPP